MTTLTQEISTPDIGPIRMGPIRALGLLAKPGHILRGLPAGGNDARKPHTLIEAQILDASGLPAASLPEDVVTNLLASRRIRFDSQQKVGDATWVQFVAVEDSDDDEADV